MVCTRGHLPPLQILWRFPYPGCSSGLQMFLCLWGPKHRHTPKARTILWRIFARYPPEDCSSLQRPNCIIVSEATSILWRQNKYMLHRKNDVLEELDQSSTKFLYFCFTPEFHYYYPITPYDRELCGIMGFG